MGEIPEYIRFMNERRSSFQIRGLERRRLLIETCRALLKTHHVGQFGLAEVAALAGMPKTSVYHFFPRIDDLLGAVAVDVAADLLAYLIRPIERPFEAWPQVAGAFVEAGRDFYAEHRDAMEMQLGPFTPSDIKNRDRNNDMSVGVLLKTAISRHFVIPDLPDLDGVFFRSVEIADLMFMLSVREHGHLTAFYVTEAARAMCAYLGLYLPPVLPRAGPGDA
jgi:AcrR family transcriptional regulator